jgi:hypothetical protein
VGPRVTAAPPGQRATVAQRRPTSEPQRLHPQSACDEETQPKSVRVAEGRVQKEETNSARKTTASETTACDEQKPANSPPHCEPNVGTIVPAGIRSAHSERTNAVLQTVVVGSQGGSSSEEEMANKPEVPERSSSDEDVPSATLCNGEVVLTVQPAEEEQGDDVRAPSCCRDRRDQCFVGLHSTSIVIWVALGACWMLPVAAFWSVFVVLMMVHVVEGYYSETHCHLRHPISSQYAVQLLNRLHEAAPKIAWHVGAANGTLKVLEWHDISKRAPDLQQYAMTKLTIKSDYTVAEETRDLSQMRDFCTLHLQSPTDTVQESLMIAGFSEFTHRNSRSTCIMKTMVSAGETHPLVNPLCFWVCHLSVVMAFPYRLWLSSMSGAVTHVVAKNIFC